MFRRVVDEQLEKGNSKKDTRSELEHELDQAEWTYNNACEQLTRKADELEEGTGTVVEALKGVIDAQLGECSKKTNHSFSSGTDSSLPSLLRLCNKLYKHATVHPNPTSLPYRLCLPFYISHSFSFLDSSTSSLARRYENESIAIRIISPERSYSIQ